MLKHLLASYVFSYILSFFVKGLSVSFLFQSRKRGRAFSNFGISRTGASPKRSINLASERRAFPTLASAGQELHPSAVSISQASDGLFQLLQSENRCVNYVSHNLASERRAFPTCP